MIRALLRFAAWIVALALLVLVASKIWLDPTYTVSSEVTIRVPHTKVWAKVGDLNEWTEWVKGLEQVSIVKGDGRAVGSMAEIRVYNGFRGWDMSIHLVNVIPELRVGYQVLGGPQNDVLSTINLESSEDGRSVRVAWTESHTLEGLWANLRAAVIGSIVTTQHDESLNQLKFHLERGL
ncbi:MAG: SRPBCC family protein [Nitrospirota bacterium]